MRQHFVEQSLEAALRSKPTTRQYACKRDGVAEAHLLALACSPASEGRAHWTLRLLADKFVELRCVPTISYETIRRTLKKPTTATSEAVLGDTARTQCAFVTAMEDVLTVYQRPLDSAHPVICMDETSKQLISETRVPLLLSPGQLRREDYEYE